MRKIVFGLLLLLLFSNVQATTQYLYYSDQIKEGQVYSWYIYPEYLTNEEITAAGPGANYTIEVLKTPDDNDVRAIHLPDYFQLYINGSTQFGDRYLYQQTGLSFQVLLQPTVVNKSINFFENIVETGSFDNASISDGIFTVEYFFVSDQLRNDFRLIYDVATGVQLYSAFKMTNTTDDSILSASSTLLISPSPAFYTGSTTSKTGNNDQSDTDGENVFQLNYSVMGILLLLTYPVITRKIRHHT